MRRSSIPFLDYEWDHEKAKSNHESMGFLLKKLPPSNQTNDFIFQYRRRLANFDDPLYVDFYDPDHSVVDKWP
jgi:hypothetical protein